MNYRTSIKALLLLVILVILFHVTVIVKGIPYNIAWGGALQSDAEMYIYESASILIILFFGMVLLMKGEYLKFRFRDKTINQILWIFFSVFLLNTFSNLSAKANFEKLFAALTFIFAILIWTILKMKHITIPKGDIDD